MLPDVWLANTRIRGLWKAKFPAQSKMSLVNLAQVMLGGVDLTRNQVSVLINTLAGATTWPTGKGTDSIDPAQPDEVHGIEHLLAANHTHATVEPWVLELLSMVLAIPNDVSVLDLYCGNGDLLDALPATAYYEGHDPNPVHIARARRAHPKAMFQHTDLTQLLVNEVDAAYGLVFCHTAAQRTTVTPTCLETREALEDCVQRRTAVQQIDQLEHYKPGYRVGWALAEVAVKCCVPGGIVVLVTLGHLRHHLSDFLKSKGTILAEIACQESMATITIFRKVKVRGYETHDVFYPTSGEVLEWAATQGELARVPVCSDDPRPMVIREWDIELASNQVGNAYGRCQAGCDAELYLAKGRVGTRWADRIVALEWAQHQALTAPPEESWDKTVARFNTRFVTETYLQVRLGNLNAALNLPEAYTVREDPALTKHIGRFGRQLDRMQLSYPEKTTLDNRYYTLGIGSVLVRGDERYEVRFSEPDFSNSKPPKVHIEKV